MSKPRSKLINYAARDMRTVRGFTTALHFGRQAKHMPGQPNHDPAKSIVTVGIKELQRLVELKAGTGRWRGTNKEVVDFGVRIGTYRRNTSDKGRATTKGTIHYAKAGAHVVPAAPTQTDTARGKS